MRITQNLYNNYRRILKIAIGLNPFGMGFLMDVKPGYGEGMEKSTAFTNDAKKLKLTQKLKNLKNFPKYQIKIAAINIFC